jgi:3-oxoacyl-[acyl-carrier protein] reductase|tara:strand:+ start:76 stop:762 length:687 start_codon:yes stop_codon:yes gene_type:complete
MNLDFQNKVVVITGASRGIGKSLMLKFQSEGAQVLGLSSKDYDLSSREDIKSLALHLAGLPKVDILINNAGINKINVIEDISLSDYDNVMRVNVEAPFLLSQAVIPRMIKNKSGRIINITSIFGHCTKEQRMSYTTSKYALSGMTKTMSVELAPHNIMVNSVAPGFTETDLTRQVLGQAGMDEVSEQIPMKRLAQPREIADVVMFLASDNNSYLTGQNIIVDGGFVNV